MIAVEALDVHRDARGLVFEPVAADELAGMRNVHVVVTVPGQVRGNHYHTRGTEWMSVLGPARVRVRSVVGAAIEESIVPAGESWRFIFPPRVSHAVVFTGRETGLLVSFVDAPHDPADPDTFRDPLFTQEELAAPRP